MRKKMITLVMCLMVVSGMQARSMREIWSALPDTLLPYVDRNHRLEMVEFIDMRLRGDVDNLLGGKSEMDTITADYIHLTLSPSSTMEVKRLPVAGGDSLLCMVRTFLGPEAGSLVSFYHQDWSPAAVAFALDSATTAMLLPRLLVKPDTMSAEHFARYRKMVTPYIIGARLSPDNDFLDLRLALPIPVKDERPALESITPTVALQWDASEMNFRHFPLNSLAGS